jgi:SAM-dependent methyltransferase
MSNRASPAAAMWDEPYAQESYAYGLNPNAFLASQAHRLKPGMRAFVPGDGEGRNGVWLAEQGHDIDTFDLSAHGVAKSKALASQRGVRLSALQADALTWDWPEARYDLIAPIYPLLIAPERRFVHAQALKALKAGGLLVLQAFRKEQIERHAAGTRGGPRDAALLYSVEALAEDFSATEILLLEATDAPVDEGWLHAGESAGVRAVARKR